MEQTSIATQRAMAAEIRSRLGYMNRSQAWLQKQAEVPSATWRKYFTEGAIEREVPLPTVARIASVLGMTTGQLVSIAEENAPAFAVEMISGATEAEKEDLRRAMERTRPTPRKKANPDANTG